MYLYRLFSTDDLSMKTWWVQRVTGQDASELSLLLFTTFDGFHSFVLEPGCVDDGWFKQPHLATGRLMKLWGRGSSTLVERSVIKAHRINKPSPHNVFFLPCALFTSPIKPTQTPNRPNRIRFLLYYIIIIILYILKQVSEI